MIDDNNKNSNNEEILEESIETDGTFDPEDRFTTQDISDIDKILNGSKIPNENLPKADSSLLEPGKKEKKDIKPEEVSATTKPAEEETEKAKTPDDAIEEAINAKAAETSASEETNTENKAKKEKMSPLGFKRNKGLPRKRKPRTWTKTLAMFVGVMAILGAIGFGGIYLLYTANFTDISTTKYTPKEKTEIYTADNVVIAQLYSENRTYISIEQVPQSLIQALVATEDSRFYSHHGVDYIGVLRALVSNIIGGNSTGQGASTITQQLARLLYLPDISTESTFLDSLNRKFKEISISYQLEDKYTKNQILEMYLNEYYLGSGAYGIEAAAETYFGKTVSELNLAESALLAGLPQAPSSYAPNSNFEAAKARQLQVLNRMVDQGYITQEEADEAYNTEITIVPWSEDSLNNQIEDGYSNFVGKVLSEYAKAVAPNIMKERGLSEDEAITYARHTIASGGYKIYTTLNSSYQNTAINTVGTMLSNLGYNQANGYTAALVTVDKSGAVRAYYGGNEEYSDIDMADSPRQPGSNIKPLYYALALEKGLYTSSSTVYDSPISINGYSPKNAGGGYMGAISFATSLIQSRNVTSVQIFNKIGVQTAVDWLKQFGFDTITDDDYNLAVALGGLTYGLKPYQVAAAFNTFNDNGVYNQAYFIERVTTSAGDPVLDKSQLNLVSTQLISQQTATTMWNILRQIVTSSTGTRAQNGLPTAGKTGTTDNEENLWFTGMTADITTSIWLGNLDYKVLGRGSYVPASIYGQYLRNLINEGYIE